MQYFVLDTGRAIQFLEVGEGVGVYFFLKDMCDIVFELFDTKIKQLKCDF